MPEPKREENATDSTLSCRWPETGKRPYRKPRLIRYGDVRDLTLGGSIGFGESGNPNRFPD